MTDTFHSCYITPNGISVKVFRDGVGHRSAIGIGDYDDRLAYLAAVNARLADLLDDTVLIAQIQAAVESNQTLVVKAAS